MDEHFFIKLILVIFHHNLSPLFDSVHHINYAAVVILPLSLYPFTFYTVHMSHTTNICWVPQRKVYIADLQYPQLPNPCYVDLSVYLYSPFVQHVLQQSFTDTSIYTKPVESDGNEKSLILYGYTLGTLITVCTARMGPPLPFTDNLSSSWSMYAVHCIQMVIRFQILSTATMSHQQLLCRIQCVYD